MSKNTSVYNVFFIITALLVGAAGGYLIQYIGSQQTIQSQQATINTQTEMVSMQEQRIIELEGAINEYNKTIQNQLNELQTLTDELTNLVEAQKNETEIIEALELSIATLETEINENNFEILNLKARLGDRLTWNKYQNHDFSFEYPDWMDLSIVDYGYEEGIVLSINWIDPINYFYYTWISIQALEVTVQQFEDEHDDLQFMRRDIISTTVDGHDSFLYIYNITIGDGSYHGILCIWECTVTNRVNLLFQYSSGDPLSSFFQILSTFKCHVEGEQV